ncbi:MAG: SpoIIE family protein phosphatase [Anaerolineae bacterium]|nr:SpoIIE family protein phosphatase [Anaerolineae bacterium]
MDHGVEQKTIQLAGGDNILFYTDGLTESFNNESEFWRSATHRRLVDKSLPRLQIFDAVEKRCSILFKICLLPMI